MFLFDAVAEDGRVGSTGETLDPAVVASLAEGISRPFLLAGGLSADNRSDYDELTRHTRTSSGSTWTPTPAERTER